MKIISLPDLHNAFSSLSAIGDVITTADLVLLTGDITKDGNPDEAREIIRCIQQKNSAILAVPGNWDGPEVIQLLEEEHVNLHRRKIIVDNLEILGIGASLPTGLNSPNEISEEAFESILSEMRFTLLPVTKPYILISHQPPAQTINDKLSNGAHVGSHAIRRFIEETQPMVCFTGHIHEGVGIDRIGSTYIINPGPLLQDQYAYVEIENSRVTVVEIRAVNR